jgi:hypothetical protein
MSKKDLSKPKPIESVLWGREIVVPKVVKEMLLDDEKVIHAVQQSRLEQMITPDSIFVTNKRVILHKPKTFGLRRSVEDFKYVDMANTLIDQGFISSTIKIKMRFLSDPVELKRIPTKVAREIFKTIQDGVAGRLEKLEQPDISPQKLVERNRVKAVPKDEDPLKILQKRCAKGEITTEEYKKMKRLLSPRSRKKKK